MAAGAAMVKGSLPFEALVAACEKPSVNGAGLYLAVMEHDFTDTAEATLLLMLRQRYAYLAAWLLRLNRAPEPARLPEPARRMAPPRRLVPPRQPHQPRPE